MAFLICVEGPLKGRRFELGDQAVLGRSFDADIRIEDMAVSRHHCKIRGDEQEHTIEDLRSGNGTTVNGKLITSPILLKDGDVIGLPRMSFTFRSEESHISSVLTVDVSKKRDRGY